MAANLPSAEVGKRQLTLCDSGTSPASPLKSQADTEPASSTSRRFETDATATEGLKWFDYTSGPADELSGHTRTMPSFAAVARWRPSGRKAVLFTASPWTSGRSSGTTNVFSVSRGGNRASTHPSP